MARCPPGPGSLRRGAAAAPLRDRAQETSGNGRRSVQRRGCRSRLSARPHPRPGPSHALPLPRQAHRLKRTFMTATKLIRVVNGNTPASPAASDYVIETEDLDLWYGRKRALNSLTLRVPRGRIHAIIGANGAGKSSLFRVLLGVRSPSAGRATILGHDCTALTEHE